MIAVIVKKFECRTMISKGVGTFRALFVLDRYCDLDQLQDTVKYSEKTNSTKDLTV